MEIAELVGALGSASALSTSPMLHRELRITTIHSSLMIERNTLSREAVTAILDGERVLGPARQILEVDNARRTYRLMDDLDPLSPDDLLRAHGVMMRGLIDDAGRYRAGNTGVFEEGGLIHAGTPARCIPEVMTDLFLLAAALLTACDNIPVSDRTTPLDASSFKKLVVVVDFTGVDCTNCPKAAKVYPSIDWTTAAVNIKRPRPSALFYYSICKIG